MRCPPVHDPPHPAGRDLPERRAQVEDRRCARRADGPAVGVADDRPAGTASPGRLMSGQKLVYTIAETSGVLGISEWLCRRMIKAGKIPTVHYGRRVVVP